MCIYTIYIIISIYIYCWQEMYCSELLQDAQIRMGRTTNQNSPSWGPKKCSPPNGGRRQASLFQEKTHGIHLKNFVASLVYFANGFGSGNSMGYSISHIDMEVSPSFLPYSFLNGVFLGRINDRKQMGVTGIISSLWRENFILPTQLVGGICPLCSQ